MCVAPGTDRRFKTLCRTAFLVILSPVIGRARSPHRFYVSKLFSMAAGTNFWRPANVRCASIVLPSFSLLLACDGIDQFLDLSRGPDCITTFGIACASAALEPWMREMQESPNFTLSIGLYWTYVCARLQAGR